MTCRNYIIWICRAQEGAIVTDEIMKVKVSVDITAKSGKTLIIIKMQIQTPICVTNLSNYSKLNIHNE